MAARRGQKKPQRLAPDGPGKSLRIEKGFGKTS